MDLQSLQLFLSLSRNLHFARTSEQHHISASALSRTIQRLEQELGYTLLVRDNRSVSLTPQGEMLAEFATSTLEAFAALKTDLGQSMDRVTGTLRLFASVTASQSFLPDILARFRRQYPDVQIELETGYAVDAMTQLRDHSDVVVAALSLDDEPHLVKRIVVSIPILTVYPLAGEVYDVMAQQPVDWSEVPLILPTSGQARDNIDQWRRGLSVPPPVYAEVAGNEAVLSLVALGCGVGFVPELVLENSPLRDRVRVSEEGPVLEEFHVGFCTYQKALDSSAVIQAFWQSIG